MALKWVQAIKLITRVEQNSKRSTYYPGDWFQARNLEIKKRLAAGEIAIFENSGNAKIFEPNECGIVTYIANLKLPKLGASAADLSMTISSEPSIPYMYTFYYTGGKFREEMLPLAFDLLKIWHMAIPIESFDIIASSIGTMEDRKYTKEVIGDLRVPVYDIRQICFRKCAETFALVEAWQLECNRFKEGDSRLAFLRALYTNPLLILALPPSWREGIRLEKTGG